MYRANFPGDPGMHNMGHTYTRTSFKNNPGFLDRIKSSLFGIIVGVGILFSGGILLFWNEGRAVTTAKSLDEGMTKVLSLQNNEVAFEENNHKLVHVIGPLITKQFLEDEDYSVKVKAVKLKRHVEMYQWIEQEKKREFNEGGQTRKEITYSYYTDWRPELIDSFKFDNPAGHHNPKSFTIATIIHVNKEVFVGNFILSTGLIDHISNFKPYNPSNNPSNPQLKLHAGNFYLSDNPMKPQVGDLKICFSYAGVSGKDVSMLGPIDTVSIIAKQMGNHLAVYHTEAGNPLELLYFGNLSAEEIFAKEHESNSLLTWGLRAVGWLMLFLGLTCITSILPTLVSGIPIVREIVSIGVNTFNFVLSLSFSFTIVALGWIFYRPLVGITLIVIAIVPIFLARHRAKETLRHEKLYK